MGSLRGSQRLLVPQGRTDAWQVFVEMTGFAQEKHQHADHLPAHDKRRVTRGYKRKFLTREAATLGVATASGDAALSGLEERRSSP